jgi:hypothetical protein
MNKKVIYSVLYKGLIDYDGRDVKRDCRDTVYEYCASSYRRNCGNDVEYIFEVVNDVMRNTVEMYFDKMVRIRELNKTRDVLWVDGDTLCLGDLEHIFKSHDDLMKGIFWGWWDGFNCINGGIVYYPKGILWKWWDKFVYDWIKLMNKLNMDGKRFIGPYEQIPISDLMMNLAGYDYDTNGHSIFDKYEELVRRGYLLDYGYNCNPMYVHNINRHRIFDSKIHDIYKKKVLHFNLSDADYEVDKTIEYLHEKLLGYTDDCDLLLKRCDELGISNRHYYINFDKSGGRIRIENGTRGFIKLFLFDTDNFDVSRNYRCVVYPGHFIDREIGDAKYVVIKNLFSYM